MTATGGAHARARFACDVQCEMVLLPPSYMAGTRLTKQLRLRGGGDNGYATPPSPIYSSYSEDSESEGVGAGPSSEDGEGGGGGAGPCFCNDGTCTLCMFASHLARIGLERHWAPYFFAEGFDNIDNLLSSLPTDEYSFSDALYSLAVSCDLPHDEATLFAAGTTASHCLGCGGWLLPYDNFCINCGIPNPNPRWVDGGGGEL